MNAYNLLTRLYFVIIFKNKMSSYLLSFLSSLYFYYIIIFLTVFFVLFLLISIIIQRKKSGGFLLKGMNLELFLVQLPQFKIKKEGEREILLEEYLKTVEQFFSSLAGIKEHKFFKKLLFGNPFLVFEISVKQNSEEICFYVACPRYISQLIEKQILGFWPEAHIQPVLDYNIFNSNGVSVGSIAQLDKSPVFPLKLIQGFTNDPLSAITSAFTKLSQEQEGAALQILVRPSRKSLKKIAVKTIDLIQKGTAGEAAIMMAQSKTGMTGVLKEVSNVILPGDLQNKKKLEQNTNKPEVSPLMQNQITAIVQKISEPLFDVNLRILASAPNQTRALEILSQIQNSFDQFSSPILNKIKFRKLTNGKLKKLFYNFSFRIFNEKEVLLLSSEEMASLFHFPSKLLTPHIKWLKNKQAPAPDNLPSTGLLLGKNIFRGEEKKVLILEKDRGRHFYIIGQTGTGKSVFLQEMIKQDIENGEGVALIDPHGDIAEKVLSFIPKNRVEDVIYFNPSDFERPLGLNMLEFDPRYPESKTLVINEMMEIFKKLYNLEIAGGPIFEQYMRNSLFLVMEDPESGSTLIEVPRVLSDADFRKYKLSRCQNIVVKNFWELEAEKAGGEAALANMVPYITSKMNVFITNDLVRPIISQQKSAFNFREVMDNGKIIIVNLAKGKLGDINSFLLGMIIIGKILIAAFSRADIPEEKRRNFYLYIDEFQNFVTNTIPAVLAEARKYHLSMIMAHQYIGQLDENTQKAIFGNVGSIAAFRVGPDDAKYLVTQFDPVFNENDLVNFDNFNAALRLLINGEVSRPFNIKTFPPSQAYPGIAGVIKELSRIKYGCDRYKVELDLNKRLSKRY